MKNIALFLLAAIVVSFSSCEKVIDVKLKSSPSQYVIIGKVSDEPGPYTVSVNKSVSFEQSNVFPAVSGATVVITDQTAGVSDTLTEDMPGGYVTHTILGQVGHTYQLYIKSEGQIFTSTATMPHKVPMDTLYQQPAEFGDGVSIVPVYTDRGGENNFYHFIEYINSKQTQELYYRRDIVGNGKQISVPLNLGSDTSMHVGSTVTISMESIDSAMYQYYRSLDETIGQSAASPANPLCNIQGAKLGYFSVHAVDTRTIVIY